MPTITSNGRGVILQLQWLRGGAAGMVLLYHLAAYRQIVLHDDTLVPYTGSWGLFGVSIFFTISGYLMSVLIRVQEPATFLMHRIVRIYPALLIAVALVVALSGQAFPFSVRSLLLMPLPGALPYLRIEWTLWFELAFYVGLFIVARLGQAKRIGWIGLAWLVVIAVSNMLLPKAGTAELLPIYRLLTVSNCAPMALGLLIPYLPPLRTWRIAMGLGLSRLPWILLPHYAANAELVQWLIASSSTMLVWSIVSIPQDSGYLRWGIFGKILQRLGDYSYGLYLIHATVLYRIFQLCGSWPVNTVTAFALSAALASGIVLGQVDTILHSRVKRWLRGCQPALLRHLSSGYAAVYLVVAVWGGAQFVVDEQRDKLMKRVQGVEGIASASDADRAATKAGFLIDQSLTGESEKVTWDATQQRLIADLWAFDPQNARCPLIALFRDGKLLKAGMPTYVRDDVSAALHLHRHVKTGMHFELPEKCDPHKVVAVVFTVNGGYRVLPNTGPAISCRASAGESPP